MKAKGEGVYPIGDLILVYVDKFGEQHDQPAADVVEVGTLIDEDDGEDMELIGCRSVDNMVLDKIARALDGVEWSPDTLDRVAEMVRRTGREVRDPEDKA